MDCNIPPPSTESLEPYKFHGEGFQVDSDSSSLSWVYRDWAHRPTSPIVSPQEDSKRLIVVDSNYKFNYSDVDWNQFRTFFNLIHNELTTEWFSTFDFNPYIAYNLNFHGSVFYTQI